jgi:hypothetical protein
MEESFYVVLLILISIILESDKNHNLNFLAEIKNIISGQKNHPIFYKAYSSL